MDTVRCSAVKMCPSAISIPPWVKTSFLSIFKRAAVGCMLFASLGSGIPGVCRGEETDLTSIMDETLIEDEMIPAFCMNSSIMNQLLQGFGSRIVFDERDDFNLVCGSQIVREERIDNRVILEVELECSCVCSDGDCIDINQLEGNWVISIAY